MSEDAKNWHFERVCGEIGIAIQALKQTKQIGCTGCEHYDQQQTRLICHGCKRYYSDKYKGGEDK
jgi:hypothetical protein